MMSLKNNPAFKKDYARYQEEIRQIVDEKHQKELTSMLLDFLNEVNSIDFHHEALFQTGKLPEATRESRTKLASIKKKLDAKLSLYKSQQKARQA